jgi:hypothetical protein
MSDDCCFLADLVIRTTSLVRNSFLAERLCRAGSSCLLLSSVGSGITGKTLIIGDVFSKLVSSTPPPPLSHEASKSTTSFNKQAADILPLYVIDIRLGKSTSNARYEKYNKNDFAFQHLRAFD